MWEEFTPEQIQKKIARQSNFSWAFYDIETSQARYDGENFEYLPFHQAVMIVIGKVRSDVLPIRPVSSQVCFQCHDKEESEHCENCGDRFAIFKYTKEDKDDQAVSSFTEFHLENATQVVRRFVDYITQDVSMQGRILLAHNGGK